MQQIPLPYRNRYARTLVRPMYTSNSPQNYAGGASIVPGQRTPKEVEEFENGTLFLAGQCVWSKVSQQCLKVGPTIELGGHFFG